MANVALRVHDLLPDTGIVIAADNDEAGRNAAEQTEKALLALRANCQIIYPTPTCKDFNDMLLKVGADNPKTYLQEQIKIIKGSN
jgi:phage/plasmid primase-like uncharacterized protein